jgi:hypothetical protein
MVGVSEIEDRNRSDVCPVSLKIFERDAMLCQKFK